MSSPVEWILRVMEMRRKDPKNEQAYGMLAVICPSCERDIPLDENSSCKCGNKATYDELVGALGLEEIKTLLVHNTLPSEKRRD